MSKEIIVGPLLGYEHGDYYTVCVLVPPDIAPVLKCQGQSVPFTRITEVGTAVFWRVELQVQPSDSGMKVPYEVVSSEGPLQDQHGRTNWEFYVPGKSDQPLIAYASCNGFSSGKLARDTDDPYHLWTRMGDIHKSTPYSLLLMGGDQVYADEIWESRKLPALQEWAELDSDEQEDAQVTQKLQKEIRGFYDWLYPDRWCDENMSLMLASIPSVMMWDDHDIFDGWGSYPESRQQCPVFQEVFTHAARVFDLFQLRASTRNRINPQAVQRSLRLRFRNYLLLVLDNRSERTLDRIMSEDHWTDVKNELSNLKDNTVSNLLIMTAVPVVYRSFSTVEALFAATPWREELEDDVRDHWSSRHHEAERMRMIMVLFNFLKRQANCKALLLSGDVHVGGIGQFYDSSTGAAITQLISSGMVHPPPTALAWAGLCALTSDDPEALGEGDIEAEMLDPFGADRYLRTRNYATLQLGTDDKIWINWICEDEKLKPSFAVS